MNMDNLLNSSDFLHLRKPQTTTSWDLNLLFSDPKRKKLCLNAHALMKVGFRHQRTNSVQRKKCVCTISSSSQCIHNALLSLCNHCVVYSTVEIGMCHDIINIPTHDLQTVHKLQCVVQEVLGFTQCIVDHRAISVVNPSVA